MNYDILAMIEDIVFDGNQERKKQEVLEYVKQHETQK